MARNRGQAIIWSNAGPMHWRIYSALGGDVNVKFLWVNVKFLCDQFLTLCTGMLQHVRDAISQEKQGKKLYMDPGYRTELLWIRLNMEYLESTKQTLISAILLVEMTWHRPQTSIGTLM